MIDVVLVGLGHAHLMALRYWSKHPLKKASLTVISDGRYVPYSGMVSGYLCGFYTQDQLIIDAKPLLNACGARFVEGRIDNINTTHGHVTGEHHVKPVYYDFLSINSGGSQMPLELNNPFYLAIKPLGRFLSCWPFQIRRLESIKRAVQIIIIGAGVSGVEIALTIARYFGQNASVRLINPHKTALATLPKRARSILLGAMEQSNITVVNQSNVARVNESTVVLDDQTNFEADLILDCRGVRGGNWLQRSGLPVTDMGFVPVKDTLQTTACDSIFAVGDVADMIGQPRDKAGVFSVRQGVPLAKNIQRLIDKQPLLSYSAQRYYLSLINTADKRAVGIRGQWVGFGRYLWWLKNWIDRRFVKQFR